MHHPGGGLTRRGCLAALALTPLAGRAAAAEPQAEATAAMQRLLVQTYGRPDPASGAWRAHRGGHDYVLRAVATRQVDAGQRRQWHVLLSGSLRGSPAADMQTPGVIGAHALEERAGQWTRVASSALLPAGAWGQGPESAQLVQLGPDHLHGWTFETGAMGQGHVSLWRAVLLPQAGRFVPVAHLLASMDNEGAYDCEGERPDARCMREDYPMTVDRSGPGPVWPLQVRLAGQRGGKPMPEKRWRVPFDAERWRYDVPRELRGG